MDGVEKIKEYVQKSSEISHKPASLASLATAITASAFRSQAPPLLAARPFPRFAAARFGVSFGFFSALDQIGCGKRFQLLTLAREEPVPWRQTLKK